jgi:GT2 family glycosyltransferase
MSGNALSEVQNALSSGRFIGGGTRIKFSRSSPGLIATHCFKELITLITGLCGGMFWFLKRDFETINGFDESIYVAEDVDFACRLKSYGRQSGKRFITLPRASITTSSRKFDKFGDWKLFSMLLFENKQLRQSLKTRESEFSSKYFYDFEH